MQDFRAMPLGLDPLELFVGACFAGVLLCAALWLHGRARRVKAAPASKTAASPRRPQAAKPAKPITKPAVKPVAKPAQPLAVLPTLDYEEDQDLEPTNVSEAEIVPVAQVTEVTYEEDALEDEPTAASPAFSLVSSGATDTGRRRKRNEDSLLVLEGPSVYVVADGMGGYAGGALASSLAVRTVEGAFAESTFEGADASYLPRRAAELVKAVGAANAAIRTTAVRDAALAEMGTTIVAARFCPEKRRLYVSHVGDSRCYRLRDGQLMRLTRDHTMGALGYAGPEAHHLSRAVGIGPSVDADVAILKPQPDDVYLLCSDGLTKMVPDEVIEWILATAADADAAVASLVAEANERGGKDNVTAIVVFVRGEQAAAA